MNKEMLEDERIKLTDIPYGDGYIVVYTLEHESTRKVYSTVNPRINEKGEYYQVSFKDIMKEIETKEKKKIDYFIMSAESGLSGIIYRYNNYMTKELLIVGTTKGYA